MTDHGRGSGSQPWYPGDPSDENAQWTGDGTASGGWNGQGAPQQHPQHQGHHQGWDGQQGWDPAQAPADPYAGGQYGGGPQGGYGEQGGYGQQGGQYPQQGQHPQGQYPQQDQYGGQGGYGHQGQGQYPGQDPYGNGAYPGQDPYAPYPGQDAGYGQSGAYPPGQQFQGAQYPGGQYPGEQYPDGQYPPQGGHPQGGHPQGGHPGEPYQGGPGPQQGGHPQGGPQQGGPYPGGQQQYPDDPSGPEAADPSGLPQDDEEEDHPFFADGPDRRRSDRRGRDDDASDEVLPEDDYADDAEDEDGGRGRKKKEKKRRSGCACLVVVLVLGGGLGGAGYYGYDFWKTRFGPAPDFAGEGTGQVEVEVPKGAGSTDIGNILFDKGVVKSVRAFVDEAKSNSKSQTIQPGVYLLKKEMSAESAMQVLTDPASLNNLIIPEGKRATWIYEAIDTRLKLEKGTTKDIAEKTDLGLPEYAKGNPEGFLYPSAYAIGKNTKPADLLKEMVDRAEEEYAKDDLEQAAENVGRTPYEVIILASIVQAEAQEDKDFGKVARVMYNRLSTDATNGLLQMDSTVNYALNRSTLDVSASDTSIDSPYNTYKVKGLPPGPIGNPGHQAVKAAAEPTEGPWVYFVTVKPGDTRFTDDPEEHGRNVEDFNAYQRENGKDEEAAQ